MTVPTLEAISVAQLSSVVLEDVIADSLEEEAGGGGQVAKLVVLSARVAGDAALARQLRRKFA